MARKTSERRAVGPKDGDRLESFLSAFENFAREISAECALAAPKGEQQILIQSTGESFVGQTTKVLAFVRETAGRLSAVQRIELDRFLQVQDGEAYAGRGVAVTKQLLRSGVIGRLLHWLSQHLKELKKILSEIVHFILDLLHIPFPDWFDRLLQVLDQFLDLLLSLLSEVFGIDFGRAARQFSEQEVDFLREWAAFEAVRTVRAGRKTSGQDDTK
ncbi:MAG: hypothetical protein Q8L22_04955 [Reyranella sp.]|nr:hypothetical protein [Reyranella sp.]